MRVLAPVVVLVVGLVLPTQGHGAADPVKKCTAAKIKAAGKRAACLAGVAAKEALGKTGDAVKCQLAFTKGRDKADAGAAKKGAACRLVDNGDGTVSDLDTQLMWEQKTVANVDTTVTWATAASETVSLTTGTSANGEQFSGSLAGYQDWRLPSVIELETIVDFNPVACGNGGLCIGAVFGPTHLGPYWAITTDQSDAAKAWIIGFGDGALAVTAKTGTAAVRAVRGGP